MHSNRLLIKAAIIVTPLLGITWVFGLLAVNESAVAFAWIFTILNSLQVHICKCVTIKIYLTFSTGFLHYVFLCAEK